MEYEIVTLQEKKAVGGSVRTSNHAQDMSEKMEEAEIHIYIGLRD